MLLSSHQFNLLEENMAFKKLDVSIGFTDLALAGCLEHNHNLKLMENLNASID